MPSVNPDVVELHVLTINREYIMHELAAFCEMNGIPVVRLFWRGVEPEDREAVEDVQ